MNKPNRKLSDVMRELEAEHGPREPAPDWAWLKARRDAGASLCCADTGTIYDVAPGKNIPCGCPMGVHLEQDQHTAAAFNCLFANRQSAGAEAVARVLMDNDQLPPEWSVPDVEASMLRALKSGKIKRPTRARPRHKWVSGDFCSYCERCQALAGEEDRPCVGNGS